MIESHFVPKIIVNQNQKKNGKSYIIVASIMTNLKKKIVGFVNRL